jgi:hypothetical protein
MHSLFTDKGLSNYITIYIPTTINVDTNAPADLVQSKLLEVTKYLSVIFGGATTIKGVGSWYSTDLNKVVNEEVYLVKAFTDLDITHASFYSIQNEIEHILKDLKETLSQEAISYEVNGDLRFFY